MIYLKRFNESNSAVETTRYLKDIFLELEDKGLSCLVNCASTIGSDNSPYQYTCGIYKNSIFSKEDIKDSVNSAIDYMRSINFFVCNVTYREKDGLNRFVNSSIHWSDTAVSDNLFILPDNINRVVIVFKLDRMGDKCNLDFMVD